MARESAEGAASTTLQAASGTRRIYFGYWLIGAAFVAQFVAVGSQNYVVGAFLKPMTDDLGWTRAEFTYARTIAQVIMAFTGFFIGAHVDRHGGRRLMLIGITILSSSLFALSFVQQLWHWIVLNGLMLTIRGDDPGTWSRTSRFPSGSWRSGAGCRAAFDGVAMAGVLLTPAMTELVDEWGWEGQLAVHGGARRPDRADRIPHAACSGGLRPPPDGRPRRRWQPAQVTNGEQRLRRLADRARRCGRCRSTCPGAAIRDVRLTSGDLLHTRSRS